MTAMLKELDLHSLESRRNENRLCQLYKISNDLVPAILKGDYLTKQRTKRKTKATMDDAFVRENFVENYQNLHDNCYIAPETNTPIYRNSFFPRTLVEWNQLKDTSFSSVEAFRKKLQSI